MTDFERAMEAVKQFCFDGSLSELKIYGNGHINDTYLATFLRGSEEKKMILQRINSEIFKKPAELMENILMVTSYLRMQIEAEGGNPDRETLNVVCAKDGKPYYKDEEDNYYRMYYFIEDTNSFDTVKNPNDFYESAVAFGHFQRMLSNFPAEKLYEIIPGFHDTGARFERFCQVVREDKLRRAVKVQEEIKFVMDRAALTGELGEMQARGELPLRVTHNDTKLNNILLDKKTGKAICVIDLDTVMPGLAVNDFGDSIRFGASTALEDETDLSKVECSMELFEIYTKGFTEGCDGRLTRAELEALPLGAKVMTFECGMRFLTDYLEGDVYFKIHRRDHNLDRCRTQFKLVADMEKKWDEMKQIVSKYM